MRASFRHPESKHALECVISHLRSSEKEIRNKELMILMSLLSHLAWFGELLFVHSMC